MLRVKRRLNEILAPHTGQPMEVIQRDTERDFFLSAEEAVACGLLTAWWRGGSDLHRLTTPELWRIRLPQGDERFYARLLCFLPFPRRGGGGAGDSCNSRSSRARSAGDRLLT